MFTGLVEGIGRLRQRLPEGNALRLVVDVTSVFESRSEVLGASVALNGCCLTLVEIDGHLWSFQAGTETLSKTNLGEIPIDGPVNLELPLQANARLGGHFVQGHIDGVGHVTEIVSDGEWITIWFEVPDALKLQLVPKGSVAVDGVSLTVVEVLNNRFSVALIPHTLSVTTLGVRQVGDAVNIETDILGKYVQRFLTGSAPEGQGPRVP